MKHLSPTDERRGTLSQLRQKLRMPLHQIISYAELIAEERRGQANPEIVAQVAALRVACEATLVRVHAAFERAGADEREVPAGLRDGLSENCSQLHTAVDSLQQLNGKGAPEALAADIEKIRLAAESFAAALRSIETAADWTKPETFAPTPDTLTSGSSVQGGLIVSVEYRGLLLVVDDDEGNRDVLSRRLLRDGYEVMFAESGHQALRMLRRYNFDLVLLDITMPEMDGTQVLTVIRHDSLLCEIPVVMVSAVDEIQVIAQCIEAGADDYLLKPFNPTLLRARVKALLERKQLQNERDRRRDELQALLEENKQQREQSEQLLLNILPPLVARELRESGSVKPMYFEDVTIVFADIVGFTQSTEQLPADDLVHALGEYFTACDKIMFRYGLEKLKTIGDCYMYAGGIPVRNPSHPVDSVLAALDLLGLMRGFSEAAQLPWKLRIGIHTGPVIAGVVGIHKFAFDIWGDAVNFAARIEAAGEPDRINLSASTFSRVKDFLACERRGPVTIKDGRAVEMFFLSGLATGLLGKQHTSALNAFKSRYSTYFRKDLQAYPEFLFEAASTAQPPNTGEK